LPRPFRLEYPGACWHVYNRGVDRRDIFLDDTDRCFFVDLLGQVAAEYKWRVFAYAEMTNHYHGFVQTLEPTLSRGMQALEGDFAARFNRRRRRVGALFQSRFRAHLVERRSYLLELARYIVLNLVRARMVERPDDWAWSSYRATAGLVRPPEWLDVRTILDHFDEWDRSSAMRLYREFVAAGVGLARSPWEDLRACVYHGSDRFMAQVEELTAKRPEKPSDSALQRNVRALTPSTIADLVESHFSTALLPKRWRNEEARLVYAWLSRQESVATYREIGDRLSLSAPGARSLFARAVQLERTNRDFRKRLQTLQLQISQLKTRV
jgi:putative transposase